VDKPWTYDTQQKESTHTVTKDQFSDEAVKICEVLRKKRNPYKKALRSATIGHILQLVAKVDTIVKEKRDVQRITAKLGTAIKKRLGVSEPLTLKLKHTYDHTINKKALLHNLRNIVKQTPLSTELKQYINSNISIMATNRRPWKDKLINNKEMIKDWDMQTEPECKGHPTAEGKKKTCAQQHLQDDPDCEGHTKHGGKTKACDIHHFQCNLADFSGTGSTKRSKRENDSRPKEIRVKESSTTDANKNAN
jgi:hypothetical protein